MKTIINDCGSVEITSDAFKIEVSEDGENINIKVLDFDVERKHAWNIIQTQIIEKKQDYLKDILTHVHEQIDR